MISLLDSCLGVGKSNKKSREQLMREAGIYDKNEFKKQLAIIKETKLVFFDDGYYLPTEAEDFEVFINKCNRERKNLQNLINMAQMQKERIERKNGKQKH